MGTVGCRKSIVDIKFAIGGQLAGKVHVVSLLAGVEANIFQQQNVAVDHMPDCLSGRLSDTVLGEMHPVVEHLLDDAGDGAERHAVVDLTLRAAEMCHQNHPGAARR